MSSIFDGVLITDNEILKNMFSVKKKRDLVIHKIVEKLLFEYDFKTIFETTKDVIYVYREGIYINEGKDIIRVETEKILEEYCKNQYVSEIIGKIARTTKVEKENFGIVDVNLICLNNGVFDLRTKELLPHSPEYGFMSKIPVNYSASADCPNIKKFLKDVLYEEDISTIQEWIGYLLYREYFIKKAMILVGSKDTGKTTLLNVITSFIGKENTVGISLQKISTDKFAAAFLRYKHLNSFDDLSSNDVEDNGGFKMLTGKGYISGEFKFGDKFQFINYAKLIFATNSIPSTKDNSDDAYFGRWIPIRFDNVFDDSNENTNKFLIDDLTTEEEMSGLLNYALEGLQKILKTGRFSYNKTTEEIRSMMQRSGSPLIAFVQDSLTREDGCWISKDDLYNAYRLYVDKNKMPLMTKDKFGKNITKTCFYIIDSRQGVTTGWRNAKLLGDYSAQQLPNPFF